MHVEVSVVVGLQLGKILRLVAGGCCRQQSFDLGRGCVECDTCLGDLRALTVLAEVKLDGGLVGVTAARAATRSGDSFGAAAALAPPPPVCS